MQRKNAIIVSLLPLALLTSAALADESGEHSTSYELLKTISIPNGGVIGFDISWVDAESGRYYLADRGGTSTTTPRIDVIDTRSLNVLYQIPLPIAANGVLTFKQGRENEHGRDGEHGAEEAGTLVAGLNNHTTMFVDLDNPLGTPTFVDVGGTARSDELAYDPRHQLILIANDREAGTTADPRFVTFISTNGTPHVVGKILYPQATSGLEQPVWDGAKNRFYLSIPTTVANANGEVDEIDPVAMTITHVFPTSCGPAGLVLLPGQRLMTSCGDVIQISTGVTTNVAGVGGDEIWYNRGDGRVYFGGGTDRIHVSVVSASKDTDLITALTVGQIFPVSTPPVPNHTTHSVAADSETNRIFVPVGYEGVKVYTEVENDDHGDN